MGKDSRGERRREGRADRKVLKPLPPPNMIMSDSKWILAGADRAVAV